MAAKPQSEGEMEPPASERAKLFIGGLSNETREPELREYFGMFGEVKDAVVMTDRLTGNARGFGFVCFVDPEAADTALRKTEHVICGKKVRITQFI
ncbi:heterogeneous nuclear ribonucleoprotein 1-like [Canna indica]|uniref:Heterogeneous nuclear ribonucleoprotein 1-like n=1 Tax=Canna indica TaxID=4628 RepID=A0AAQ3KHZ1_9LILI|nr:heterogeneous nuclear ribonucleoprotein 1-like [Canna indica]